MNECGSPDDGLGLPRDSRSGNPEMQSCDLLVTEEDSGQTGGKMQSVRRIPGPSRFPGLMEYFPAREE